MNRSRASARPAVPSPARRENRRIQHRLLKKCFDARRVQKMKHIGERKTVLLAQRNIQSVVGGGGLQLKIERPAKSLAQRQAPRFVDPPAKRSVNHQLHAAAFVEESLGDNRLLRGNRAQHRAARHDVFHSLLGARFDPARIPVQPRRPLLSGTLERFHARQRSGERIPIVQSADLFSRIRQLAAKAPPCATALRHARTERSEARRSHLRRAPSQPARGESARNYFPAA